MKTNHKMFLSAAALALSFFSTHAMAADMTPPAPSPTPAVYNDGQIAQVLTTANNGEINEAQVAESRAQKTDVKQFAVEMQAAHAKSNVEITALETKIGLMAEQSDINEQIQKNFAAEVDALKSAKAEDFDKLYIGDQVMIHQEFLSDLDGTFIPEAKNPDLKAYLQSVRTVVQQHLTEAQKIAAELK